MNAMKSLTIMVLVVLVSAVPSFTQNENSTAITNMPGWSVQTYGGGWVPWEELVAEAFHFSPDGSFYEAPDESFRLAIAVTFLAKKDIQGHKIPIDASCGVNIILDGFSVAGLSNDHQFIELDFTKGQHTLTIINSCCNEPNCWMAMVVGKCLSGTDKNIDFVKAGGFPWRE
jgi:hypothetical protein